MKLDCRGPSTALYSTKSLQRALQQLLRCHSQTVVQRDEWQLGCVISTLPDAVGIPPQSGSARMSLSKLSEALESHPTTSPTPSHMAHDCIPSTVAGLQPSLHTDCRLYNALQPTLFVTGSCRGSTALQHSTALYSSTALQRSTVYILYNPPQPLRLRVIRE